MAACDRADNVAYSPTLGPSPQAPTSVPASAGDTPVPTPYTPVVQTGVPTYVYYAQVVHATAIALAQIIPTPSPVPSVHPEHQEDLKREYLAEAALATAVSMYPPPPGYDPHSEMTPDTREPLPTEVPVTYPYIATENGRIYSHSLQDAPEGRMMGHVNRWRGTVQGVGLTAFAGAAKHAGFSEDNVDQGILMTRQTNPQDPEKLLYHFYTPPTPSGALRVISESGGQLTLQAGAEGGVIFVFDLITRQWVSP